jgi:putative ABC transport system substrate-binding protein
VSVRVGIDIRGTFTIACPDAGGRDDQRALRRAFVHRRQRRPRSELRFGSMGCSVLAVSGPRRQRAQAILVLPNPVFSANRRVLVSLAVSHRLPVLYETKLFVEDGGLMSYGPSIPEMYRRAAWYVDRILAGAKPGDLPMERPAKFELVLNLKTARALGLGIPPALVQRADHVVE